MQVQQSMHQITVAGVMSGVPSQPAAEMAESSPRVCRRWPLQWRQKPRRQKPWQQAPQRPVVRPILPPALLTCTARLPLLLGASEGRARACLRACGSPASERPSPSHLAGVATHDLPTIRPHLLPHCCRLPATTAALTAPTADAMSVFCGWRVDNQGTGEVQEMPADAPRRPTSQTGGLLCQQCSCSFTRTCRSWSPLIDSRDELRPQKACSMREQGQAGSSSTLHARMWEEGGSHGWLADGSSGSHWR